MNILIYGKRRQGKSTLALALAQTYHQRVLVFDPNGQFPILSSLDVSEIPQWLDRTRGRNAYSFARVGPIDTEDVEVEFGRFVQAVGDEKHIALVIDEAHMLQGKSFVHPHLDNLNRRSPATVAVVQTTHRIVDAHPDSRYHADHIFFFYAALPREILTITENFGAGVAVEVPKLGRYQVLHFVRETGGRARWWVWPDGSEWFVDLKNENV